MPNAHPDDTPVTWGRFEEATGSIRRRLDSVERDTAQQFRRIEANERSIAQADENRRALALDVRQTSEQEERRRTRLWTFLTVLLTSLVLPLVVIALSVWLHLKTGR